METGGEWAVEIGGEVAAPEPTTLPLILSRAAVRRLLAAPQGLPGLALRTLYASGLREAELLALQRESWQDGRLHLPDRVVCLDSETARALSELPSGTLFPLDLRSVLADAAPLEARRFASLDRVLLPSALRHACATHCLENGMDPFVLSSQLGHASYATTANYLRAAQAGRGKAYARFHPLMTGQTPPPSWTDGPRWPFLELASPQLLRVSSGPVGQRAAPTFDEVRQMLGAATSPRRALAMRLMYASSARVNAVVHLRRGDLDPEDGKVFLRDGKEGDAYALADPETFRLAAEHGEDGDHLLGYAHQSSLHHLVDEVATRLGLQGEYAARGQTISPHSFRHSYASHCYQRGMPFADVSALLGHDRWETTPLYIHCPFSTYEAAYRRCLA